MASTAPIQLDMQSRTSGMLPDGRTLPLAWERTTGTIFMKSYASMPWDNPAKIAELEAVGAQYLPYPDEWFRGVWEPAPQQVMDAEYTADQERRRLGGGRGPALLVAGDEEEEGIKDAEYEDAVADDDGERQRRSKGKKGKR